MCIFDLAGSVLHCSFSFIISFTHVGQISFQNQPNAICTHVVGNNMTKFVFILTVASLTVSCSDKHKNVEKKLETGTGTKIDLRTIYQFSYHHGGLDKDSVVLLSKIDKSDFYNQIQIFRGQQKIFDHKDKNLEIIGTPLNFFIEQDIKTYSEYFYILRLFNGPSPDKFLILKTTKEKTTLFGVTDSNTADIFGDIDYDGKFEIGGLIDYCEAGPDGQTRCPYKDMYKVFEIDDNFPTDTLLTKYFKELIKKKK